MQNGRIDKLLTILGNGLMNKSSVQIDFKATITSNNVLNFNQNISLALSSVSELKGILPISSKAFKDLEDLESSLYKTEKETNPEVVRKSPALSKFRRLIETVTEGNNELEKAIKAVENGWDIFRGLAGKYNSIAQWCGLPQIPNMLTK